MFKFIRLKSEANGIENKAFEKERTIEKKTKTLGKFFSFYFLLFSCSHTLFPLLELDSAFLTL